MFATRGRKFALQLRSVSRISVTSNAPLFSSSASPSSLEDTVIVTRACAKRIKQLQQGSSNENMKLRLAVEGGGCSGFKYVFKMEDTALEEDDKIFERDGAKVVIDGGSFELVKGATIDFQQELIRSAFAVVNNPQSESACGCGSSFAAKAFAANPAKD